MEQNSNKRKDWIKNAAIIFLVVLLILTFFSNTILNYSLPQVVVQYITSGSITQKVRVTGNVETVDPYAVQIAVSRKVEAVKVKAGDTVSKGDVLLLLAEGESSELELAQANVDTAQESVDAAEDAVVNAQDAYEQQYISIVAKAAAGTTGLASGSDYVAQIQAARKAVDAATKDRDAVQAKVDALSTEASVKSGTSVDTTNEKKAVNDAQAAYNTAKLTLDSLQAEYNKYEELDSVSGNEGVYTGVLVDLSAKILEQKSAVTTAELNLTAAQNALSAKESTNSVNQDTTALNNQIAEQKKALAAKEKVLDEKTEALNNLISAIDNTNSLGSLSKNIKSAKEALTKAQTKLADAKKKYDTEKEKIVGNEVYAPIDGRIISVNVRSGETAEAKTDIVTIQRAEDEYTMSVSVTNEQAKLFSVGDKAELVNAWWYDDVKVTVDAIRPDTTNPNTNKKVILKLEGSSLASGQSLTVSLGSRSSNYDLIVPNSAVREDNNGKFILVVTSKSTPLGNRYTASRYDVQVLASDETQSAISAGLYGYEYVITTSTKPIEPGDQVRLPENN